MKSPTYFVLRDLSRPGRLERIMVFWAQFLTRRGYNVTLADETGGNSFFRASGIPHQVLPYKSGKKSFGNQVIAFWKWLHKKESSTVVLTDPSHLKVLAWLLLNPNSRRHRFIYFVSPGTEPFWKVSGARALKSKSVTGIFGPPQDTKNFPGWLKKKFVPMPNPSPYRPEAPNQGSTQVLYVGRFSTEKGLDLLLRAWELVEQIPTLREWKLKLVGDGEQEQTLKLLAKDLNLQRVVWSARHADVAGDFRQSRIFATTTIENDLSLTTLEALSLGLAIVATDSPGIRYVLTGGLSGGLEPMRDPVAYAKRLTNLMSDLPRLTRLQNESTRRAADFQPEISWPAWKKALDDDGN